jgi:hypothetical protein
MDSGVSTGDSPSTVIPLRDGTELRVDAAGIHFASQDYQFSQIHDARQVSPDPETIGLRLEGAGLVKLVPARPGDAAGALEAIYRFRPDLRPPVVAPPLGALWQYGPLPPPPGYAPPPPYGPPLAYPPGYPPPYTPVAYGPPPYGPPPPGYPIVPPGGVPPAYPPAPGYGAAGQPGLGPWPQGIGDVITTSFRLYFQNFRRFLLLGLAVALWPALIAGGFQMVYYIILGFNPLHGIIQQPFFTTNPSSPGAPFMPPMLTPAQILALIGAGIIVFIAALVLGSWQAASLAIGARESVLGRPIRVGAAARGGLRRLGAVLATELLLALIVIGVFVVLGVLLSLLFTVASIGLVGASSASPDTPPNVGGILLIVLLFVVFYIATLILVLYVMVRLGLAPYAAAADNLSPGRAIGRSWTLTRRNWWRTFLPILVATLAIGTVTGVVVSPLQFVSLAVTSLVVTPLITAIVTPLSVVTYMVVYYDLRLRKEGYPALALELNLMDFSAAPYGPMPTPGPGAPPPPAGPAQPGQPLTGS